MDKMIQVEYDKIKIIIYKCNIITIVHLNHVCPICKKPIIDHTPLLFIITKGLLFPNCYIHEYCFAHKSPENTIDALKENYDAAVEMKNKISHWFDYDDMEEKYNNLLEKIQNFQDLF